MPLLNHPPFTRRRKLLLAFAAGVLNVPLTSFAQQAGKVWRIGFLVPRSRPGQLESHALGAFPREMRELGYVEGKNLVIEWRFADNKIDRLRDLAVELVKMKVDVIVASATQAVSAAQKATATIPIVMGSTGDPVGSGFVRSLARPGGNITGLSNLAGDSGPKYLETILSVAPKLSRLAVLVNPENSSHAPILKNIETAGQKVRVKLLPLEARASPEIEKAFSIMAQQKAEAVIVVRDTFLNQQVRQIAELAAKNRLPAIAGLREYAEAGGLMSYGQNLAENFRRAATYVEKILKGAKPADLPVEQPTKFELVINLKTAKALGITIPQELLLRADEVIE